VFTTVLFPLCQRFGHLRAGRTFAQALDELLQIPPVSLGFDLNPSIGQVPYSPVQTESCCLLEDEPPVEHALNDPGDYDMERRFVRLICHE
jgi:hypothetical protein